jgi:dienelactone hydrolase
VTDPSNDALEDFERADFTALGRTRPVYRRGQGPSVVVLSEMPGITPTVANFARKVAERGFRVTMPHLFGTDGAPASGRTFRKSLQEVCISREFTLFATGQSSKITKWLTVLCHHEHEANGGKGVGVVGMCLTGGFALAMMVDPVVVAPVLSQPSLPIGFRSTSPAKADLGLDEAERLAVKARAEAGQCVMGLRFTGDKLVPAERFRSLQSLLGDRFIAVEIDSSPGNQWGYAAKAHSVLTEDLGTNPESPTHAALERVLTFFDDRVRS